MDITYKEERIKGVKKEAKEDVHGKQRNVIKVMASANHNKR